MKKTLTRKQINRKEEIVNEGDSDRFLDRYVNK